jgi:hypothetical protein
MVGPSVRQMFKKLGRKRMEHSQAKDGSPGNLDDCGISHNVCGVQNTKSK